MDKQDWDGIASSLNERADRVEERNPDFANTLRSIAEMRSQNYTQDDRVVHGEHRTLTYVGTLLSEVEPIETSWLWDKRIALGNVTIIWGGPGVGKSTLMADIAARVTQGWPMPDGSDNIAPGGVVLISMEDSQESTIVPRLIAAGADRARIRDLSKVQKNVPKLGGMVEQPFSLVSDLAELEAAIIACEATLVILDPIGGVFTGKSVYQNQGIRDVFYPLRMLAERLGIAIVMIGHPKKGRYKDPWDAISGSSAFGEVARSMHYVEAVQDNPGVNLLINFKNSLCPLQEPMAYRVSTAEQRIEYIRGLQIPEQKRVEAVHYGDVRVRMQKIIDDNPTLEFTSHMVMYELLRAYDMRADQVLVRKHLSNMLAAQTIQQPRRGYYASLLWKAGENGSQPSQPSEASQASLASQDEKGVQDDTADAMGHVPRIEHSNSARDATTIIDTSSTRVMAKGTSHTALQETQELAGQNEKGGQGDISTTILVTSADGDHSTSLVSSASSSDANSAVGSSVVAGRISEQETQALIEKE